MDAMNAIRSSLSLKIQKDLKKAQQKQNVEKGIGDAKGRIPSRTKVKAGDHQLVETISLMQPGRF